MRLSNIDRIDDAGIPAVQWAYDRIHEERLTQQEILDEMNSRLRQASVGEISRSGFNRYVQRVRTEGWQRPTSAPALTPMPEDPRQDRILAALRKVEAAQAELRAAIES